MSSAATSIIAQLETLAKTDPEAMAALARIGGDVDPFWLGLRDMKLNGWYNDDTSEVTPGFPVGPEDVVIDVGCGDGGALNFCAERGAYVILADVDAERITRAASWIAQKAGSRMEKHVTDANPLPVEDALVSRVICMEVLEHVDDPAIVMAELVRVGRPGARYLITVPDTAAERLQQTLAPPAYFEKPNHVRIFERADFEALVRDAGLTIERRSFYGFFWAMWWLLFWESNVDLGPAPRHPILDNWARTWAAVLGTDSGLKLKHALDGFMPKSQVIIASKPVS